MVGEAVAGARDRTVTAAAGGGFGVGLSRAGETGAAVREAVGRALAQAGLKRADWALVFFTGAHMPQADLIRNTLIAEARCANLAGCSAVGVLGEGQEVEGAPGLAVMVGGAPGLEAQSALLPTDGAGLAGLGSLGEWKGADSLVLALPDTFTVDNNLLVQRLAGELAGVPTFGAGATDDGSLGISLQMGIEGVRARSIATMGFYGAFELAVGITQSCVPLGEPRFITAARENILVELDSRSALHAFIEQGQKLGVESFQQAVQEIMFGFPLDVRNPSFVGEACVVRHLAGLDQASHGLMVAYPFQAHQSLAFMHRSAEAAEADMGRMVTRTAERLSGPPDFAVYFDCAGRGRGLYGRPGVDSALIRERLGEVPLVGMFGGFELATAFGAARVYTYTGVLLLVRMRH